MALAMKLQQLSSQLLCKSRIYLCSTTRCYSKDETPPAWNSLWRPEKYSEKDHDKIAEKYHLHPKEYKPYQEDKYLGDYPALPRIPVGAKDPYYPYDMPALRKNYHETMHDQYEVLTEERVTDLVKFRYNLGLKGALIWPAVMLGCYAIYELLKPYPTVRIWSEKQYPKKGVVHYTFEPAK